MFERVCGSEVSGLTPWTELLESVSHWSLLSVRRLHFPTSTNVRGTRNTKRSTLKSQFVGAFRLAIVDITTQTRRNEWWGRTGVGLSGQLSNLSQPLTELTDGDLPRTPRGL